MTPEESKSLKVDDLVYWQTDRGDLGKVIETGYNAVKIAWDNGQIGLVHHSDMKDVSRLSE